VLGRELAERGVVAPEGGAVDGAFGERAQSRVGFAEGIPGELAEARGRDEGEVVQSTLDLAEAAGQAFVRSAG